MKTRSSKKQTRLSFEPIASSSPSVNSYNPAIQNRLANVRFQGAKATSRSADRKVVVEESSALLTPEPSSQPQPAVENELASLSDASSTSRITPRKIGRRQEGGLEDDGTDEDEIVVPSSKRRKSNHDAAIETPVRQSARLRQMDTPDSNMSRRSRQRSAQRDSSPPIDKAASVGSAETSGDEEEVLFTRPQTNRRAPRPSRRDDPFVVSDDDEDHFEVKSKVRSRRQGAGNDFVVNDDEVEFLSSEQDEPVYKPTRRNSKGKRRNRSRREQDELDDDLQNLQDSDQGDVVETQRTRGGPVTTQRDRNREHFDLLKRRRAGEAIPRISDSDDDGQPSYEEDEEVDLDHITTVPSSSKDYFNILRDSSSAEDEEDNYFGQDVSVLGEEGYDDDDDDFIVDDESQPSRHVTAGIPLAFTSFVSRKPRELFIHIIEWLIKNKIAPAFSRDDELYALSWGKINDQIRGQAGSRLISSAWVEDFKWAILARPHMEVHLVTEGPDEMFLDCDACNRTNHPARYEFKFSGQAYHKDTLEPIDDEDDDEDSNAGANNADDTASYDQQGHLLPSTHRTYNLGRFCAANAEMGHKLTHWKYNLNQSLMEYLEEQGVLSAEAIVARDKLNKKKREKEAENIVDQMQETGMVDQLWRGLQNDLEDARFGMEDHVAKGGRRNQQRIGKVRVDRGNGRIEEWSEGGRMNLVVPDDSDGD